MAEKEIPNRKEELFRLFEQGKVPTDPEVKALRYKASSVYTFYSEWKKGAGTSKAGGKLETPLPGGDSLTGIDDTKAKASTEAKVVVEEVGKKVGEIEVVSEKREEGPPAIPELVKGGGIPIRTEVSVKTLAYFQIAADIAGDNISLGDFFDTCVEDFFQGRGQSLGLVKLNPGKVKIDEEGITGIVQEVVRQLTKTVKEE